MKSPGSVALLVHGCDRYELLYHGFAFFFQKHWDFSAQCRLYFATEEKQVSINGFQNIQSGKGQWADRLAYLLREKIEEEYVLYFQEDMWLDKNCNGSFFNELFSQTSENRWQQVKLHSSPVYTTEPTDRFVEGFRITNLNNQQSEFLMSHQVTLWKKDFLLQQLHRNEHPWRNERKGSKRLKKLNPQIIHLDYFAENGQPEINANRNPLLRSQYQAVSRNGLLTEQVLPFLEQLKQGSNVDYVYAEKLAHHYHNGVTHDGKPKPRKEDIFKRIKNLWLGK